jgi:hypothetical protein
LLVDGEGVGWGVAVGWVVSSRHIKIWIILEKSCSTRSWVWPNYQFFRGRRLSELFFDRFLGVNKEVADLTQFVVSTRAGTKSRN